MDRRFDGRPMRPELRTGESSDGGTPHSTTQGSRCALVLRGGADEVTIPGREITKLSRHPAMSASTSCWGLCPAYFGGGSRGLCLLA